MSRFFVAGLINLETTLAVEYFPLPYFPVRYPFFGVQTTVSGVGYNLAKALTTLGNQVDFASLIGGDGSGLLARKALREVGVHAELVLDMLDETAQSVILNDSEGRRQIHTDLKDIQELAYPADGRARDAEKACDLTLNMSALVVGEVRLVGSRCGPFAPALRLLAAGLVATDSLIDGRYPLSKGVQAFEKAGEHGVLKLLLTPD